MIETLTIVGVGLIGGSIGLAAKRHRLARRILGAGRQSPTLERARTLGAIDEVATDYLAAVQASDVVVFCTPVDRIAEQVLAAGAVGRPGTLLTDAGSTKAAIVEAVEGRLPAGVTFVGSHPLAGSEKRGPEHARADLFDGRLVIITPTATTPTAAVERTQAFWEALGARVRLMSPAEHDAALAVTSHLPHLVASALAGVLPDSLSELTATGFRDTTRVASGDPELWTGIFEQNRRAVLDSLTLLTERLGAFRQALDSRNHEALHDLLAQGKRARDALGS